MRTAERLTAVLAPMLLVCGSAVQPSVPSLDVRPTSCPPVVPRAATADAGVLARPATAFLDSLGVATHLSYPGTPYADRQLVETRLRELGVHHIRDGWSPEDAEVTAFMQQLGRSDIGVTFVSDPRDTPDVDAQQQMIASRLTGEVDAVESLNEPDKKGWGWQRKAISWTQQLSRAYRSDPATQSIPIIAPSLAGANSRSSHQLLSPLRPLVDFGNTHDYPGKDSYQRDSTTNRMLRNSFLVAGLRPLVATETGFSNGTTDARYPPVNEQQAASLIPRLYLDHFRCGVYRTFMYELMDEHPGSAFESGFGLVRNDGSPKPSFDAVRELISVLSANGTLTSLGRVRFTLGGVDGTTRTLLLQRADGTYALVVWRQETAGSVSKPRADVARTLTLSFATPARSLRVLTLLQGWSVDRGPTATTTLVVGAQPQVVLFS